MGQALSGNVNPTWAEQHNARYGERVAQTTGVDPNKLREAAERASRNA